MDRATEETKLAGASQVVTDYLTAYTSGDVDKALSLVSADFSFRGPMQHTAGKEAFSAVLAHVAHVAPGARGMRILRQWEDDDEVCSLYTFDVQAPARAASLLVSEWNTVRDGKVASSLMVFDTGTFQTAGVEASQAVDPVCGMTVDPATAPAHRSHRGRDYYFCNPACAQRFDDDPDRYPANVRQS